MKRDSQRVMGKVLEGVPFIPVPRYTLLDKQGNLKYTGAPLSVLLFLCRKSVDNPAAIRAGREELAAETDYSVAQVWRSIKELLDNNAIVKLSPEREEGTQRFEPLAYALADPFGSSISIHKRGCETYRGTLFANGLGYVDVPVYLLDNLKQLKGDALALAVSIIVLAHDEQNGAFTVTVKTLREMSGILEPYALIRAWSDATFRKLIHVVHKERTRVAHVELLNPKTGDTLAFNKLKANMRAEERYAMRLSIMDDEAAYKFSPEEMKKWFMAEYPNAESRNDELFVPCPGCHRNTMRIDFKQGRVGVMACHAFIDNDVVCDYSTKGKVPYHYIAEELRIPPKKAYERMQQFINKQRELQEVSQ